MIGLNDIKVEFNYTWIDGTPFDWNKFWGATEHSDTEDCVRIVYASGHWNDIDCDTKYNAFVCNYPLTTAPSAYPSNTPSESPTVIRDYKAYFVTGTYSIYCVSDDNFNITFFSNDDQVSRTFTPNSTGLENWLIFTDDDIGFITSIDIASTDSDAWCIANFGVLVGKNETHYIWSNCTFNGYNDVDSLVIDGDLSNLAYAVTDIKLNITDDSDICNYTYVPS